MTKNMFLQSIISAVRNQTSKNRSRPAVSGFMQEIGCQEELLCTFSELSDHIQLKLINYQNNQELLKNIPHIRYLDLAIVFYYPVVSGQTENQTILIGNSHMELWKDEIDVKKLCLCALRNTSIKYVPSFHAREYTIRASRQDKMYVLSNERKLYGAVSILYPKLLKNFATQLGVNLYLLPASLHEMVLIPDHEIMKNAAELRALAEQANDTEVKPEEQLSRSVYYYDRNEEVMVVI